MFDQSNHLRLILFTVLALFMFSQPAVAVETLIMIILITSRCRKVI